MIKKIICIGVVLVLCLGFFSGCNSRIRYKVAYDKKNNFGFNEDLELVLREPALIKSLDELKDLCDEYNNSAYDESSEHYSSELNEIIRGYDEKFFEKRGLIVYALWGNDSVKINSVNVDDTQLTVILGTKMRLRTTLPIITWLLIIEVKKADIEGVTTVKIEKK